jgi:micrococcal nuclease
MYRYRATVVRVVDGDTLDLMIDVGFRMFGRIRVRLLGYNAPETRGIERSHGLLAKADLQRRLPVGTAIEVRTEKGDAFGRWLADVYVNQLDLVLTLIRQGWGVEWDGRGKRPSFDPEKEYPHREF